MNPLRLYLAGCCTLMLWSGILATPVIPEPAPPARVAKAPASAPPARNYRRRGRPPILPAVRGLSYRGANGNPRAAALERRIAALELELKDAREKEAAARQELAQVRAALETISADYLKLKQELQDRAEARLSTRQIALLQLRRRLGALEVDLIRYRDDAERQRALLAERQALTARIATLEKEAQPAPQAAREGPATPPAAPMPEKPQPEPPPPPDPALAEAQRQAEAQVREATAERDRVRRLVAGGLLPRSELTRAERQLELCRWQHRAAQARQQGDRAAEQQAVTAGDQLAQEALSAERQELARLERLYAHGAIATLEVAAQRDRLARVEAVAAAFRQRREQLESRAQR